jgi:sugar phosphate isomerase/epimerase
MFDISVFADDIDQDLDRALDVVQEMGLHWIEIRSAWGKNLLFQSHKELERVAQTIHDREIKVCSVAAPIFKSRLEGHGGTRGELFHGEERDTLEEQLELIRRGAHVARMFNTQLVRCFSFWSLGVRPEEVWHKLLKQFRPAVQVAEDENITLILENDSECNLVSGYDVARFIQELGSQHLRSLWDPANAAFAGEVPYPEGFGHVRNLVSHVHIKDVTRDTDTGELSWVPVGQGSVDLAGQLQALWTDGYEGVLSIENHYTPPGGTMEDGVRQSFAGLQRIIEALDLGLAPAEVATV